MARPNVTVDGMAQCLRVLQAAEVPMLAIDIANRLGLDGSRETKRRHVRSLVKKLRDDGHMIVASVQGGYFLTADEDLWKQYLEGKKIDAKKVLGEMHRKKKMLIDKQGQGMLFQPGGVAIGQG